MFIIAALFGISAYALGSWLELGKIVQNVASSATVNNPDLPFYKRGVVFSYFVYKLLSHTLAQKLNSNVEKVSDTEYRLAFVISGQLHRLVVKRERGPKQVVEVYDPDDNDITATVEPYFNAKNMLNYINKLRVCDVAPGKDYITIVRDYDKKTRYEKNQFIFNL